MTTAEIHAEIRKLGWEAERDFVHDEVRANCAGFSTPWRTTWEQVLADVRAMKEREK